MLKQKHAPVVVPIDGAQLVCRDEYGGRELCSGSINWNRKLVKVLLRSLIGLMNRTDPSGLNHWSTQMLAPSLQLYNKRGRTRR